MTYTVVKEKLHEYIEQADKKKVKAIYALLEEDIEHGYSRAMYDDETIQVLEKISEDAFSGKTKTYTLEESMKKIRTNPKNNGI